MALGLLTQYNRLARASSSSTEPSLATVSSRVGQSFPWTILTRWAQQTGCAVRHVGVRVVGACWTLVLDTVLSTRWAEVAGGAGVLMGVTRVGDTVVTGWTHLA